MPNAWCVPDAEQRLWRTVTRKKYQLRRDRVRLHNQLESLLEEAHIKLSSLVSDLLGASARRMLKALADGETNPAALAALAHQRLRATPEQLCDALGACADLKPVPYPFACLVSSTVCSQADTTVQASAVLEPNSRILLVTGVVMLALLSCCRILSKRASVIGVR
jgi:hypothetical protein